MKTVALDTLIKGYKTADICETTLTRLSFIHTIGKL